MKCLSVRPDFVFRDCPHLLFGIRMGMCHSTACEVRRSISREYDIHTSPVRWNGSLARIQSCLRFPFEIRRFQTGLLLSDIPPVRSGAQRSASNEAASQRTSYSPRTSKKKLPVSRDRRWDGHNSSTRQRIPPLFVFDLTYPLWYTCRM